MKENSNEEKKRLFFGIEVFAPWPLKLPSGRILDESHRHMTLCFLGNVNFSKLAPLVTTSFPKPSFEVGKVGIFDKTLFLPENHPHVASWHVKWLDDATPLIAYQKECTRWLNLQGFSLEKKDEFLPHVTICRSPFDQKKWEKAFMKLPMMVKDIHLYESIGNLKYLPIWSHSLKAPFEEIEHTADIAFKIYGETILELYTHAEAALAFKFPPILDFLPDIKNVKALDDIVMALNQTILRADSEIGCPFKAVSFHGDFKEFEQVLQWEMIVDV